MYLVRKPWMSKIISIFELHNVVAKMRSYKSKHEKVILFIYFMFW